jgi:hypothetical protein
MELKADSSPSGPLVSTSARRSRSSEDSEMFTHAACLLFRRRVLHALAKPTEGRWRIDVLTLRYRTETPL